MLYIIFAHLVKVRFTFGNVINKYSETVNLIYKFCRLKAYDRNRDFQPPPLESVPAPVSVGWPVSGYQQLQKDHKVFLPKITKEQIDQYFVYRIAGT